MSVTIVNNRIIEKLLKRGDKIRSVSALHPIGKLRRNYNIDSCEEIEKEIKRLNENIDMMEGRKRFIKCQSQKNILSNHNSFEEEKNSSFINDIKQPLLENEHNVHCDNNNITPVSENENKMKLKSFKHNLKKEESKEDIINQDNNQMCNQLKSNRKEKYNSNNSNDDTTANTNMKYSNINNRDNNVDKIEKKFISNNQGYIGDEYHHNKRYQNNNKFDSCYSNRTRNDQFDIATLDSGNDLGIRSRSCLYCSKSIEIDKDNNVKLSNEEPIKKKSILKSSIQSSSSIPKKKVCTMSLIQSDIKPKSTKTSFPHNYLKNTYELYKDMKKNKMNSNSCRNIDSNKSIKINPLQIPISNDKSDSSHSNNIYSSNRIPLSSSTKTFDKEKSSQREKINSNRSKKIIDNDTNSKMSQIPLHNSKLIKYIFKSPSTSSLLRKPNIQSKQRVKKIKHIRTGSTVRADKLLKSYFELL